MKTIRLIHNLPRSGGTIISKCLAAQKDTILLSEIHPNGIEIRKKMGLDPIDFDPIFQFQIWNNLFEKDEYKKISNSDYKFEKKIDLIYEKTESLNKKLVIRDWAFADYFGKPFTEPKYKNTVINWFIENGIPRNDMNVYADSIYCRTNKTDKYIDLYKKN